MIGSGTRMNNRMRISRDIDMAKPSVNVYTCLKWLQSKRQPYAH